MKKWMRRSKYNVAKLRFSCWITNVFEQNISVIYLFFVQVYFCFPTIKRWMKTLELKCRWTDSDTFLHLGLPHIDIGVEIMVKSEKTAKKWSIILRYLLFCYLYKTNCWYNFIFRKYYLDALYAPNCSTSILILHPLDSWHSLLSSPRSKNGELNLKKSHMSVGEWIKNEGRKIDDPSNNRRSIKETLALRAHARVRVRACQGFCTFCFHNLHRLSLSTPSFEIKIKEIANKKSEISYEISDIFWKFSERCSKLSQLLVSIFLAFLVFFCSFWFDYLNRCYKIGIIRL